MSKILFLTTAHNYNDDRIFYHQAKELKSRGFQVKISSLYSDFVGEIEGIDIESYGILHHSTKEKIQQFLSVCKAYQPDCILCSEPLAVIAAHQFNKEKKTAIIYDITEWYPSMRMVKNDPIFLKPIHAFVFFLIQIYAGFISNGFIFGEISKKFPLAYLFPWKKNIILPYYPNNIYIKKSIKKLEQNSIKLCYTGSFSKEKGITSFFEVISYLKSLRPSLKVEILLIGSAKSNDEQLYFSRLLAKYNWENLTIKNSVSFRNFTEAYSEADICFDLREINFENHHCLPIKIFYYMASGKPVIYSNLKAIKNHLEVSLFGHLIDPGDFECIAQYILKYLDDPALYSKHAISARKMYEEKYNWDAISDTFIIFITNHLQPNS